MPVTAGKDDVNKAAAKEATTAQAKKTQKERILEQIYRAAQKPSASGV